MRQISIPFLATGLLAATGAAAKTIAVEVGSDYFRPDSFQAEVDDVLEFHFLPGSHSVVMGDPAEACRPVKEGGFFSGFIEVPDGEESSVSSFVYML